MTTADGDLLHEAKKIAAHLELTKLQLYRRVEQEDVIPMFRTGEIICAAAPP